MKTFSLFIILFLSLPLSIIAVDTVPPATPRGFDAASGPVSGDLLFTWTNPADSDLDHINVYFSQNGGYYQPTVYKTVTAPPNTKGQTTINNLASGTNYYVYLAAVDTSGNTSAYTAELKRTSASSPDTTSPDPATNFSAQDLATGGSLKLLWTNPSNDDFFQVRLYRSTQSSFMPDATNQIAVIFGAPASAGIYTDSGLTNKQKYYYQIRTEDNRANLQSGLSYPSVSATPTLVVTPPPPPTPPVIPPSPPAQVVAKVDLHGNPIVEGDLIRGPDGMKVYIVNNSGYKRHIFNPAVFNMYAHLSWNKIKSVSQEVLDTYATSDLYRSFTDPRVFSLESVNEQRGIALKHHLNMTAEQFITKGYHWEQIFIVNDQERDYYQTGFDIVF